MGDPADYKMKKSLPSVQASEDLIRQSAEKALRCLHRLKGMDLVEILGLDVIDGRIHDGREDREHSMECGPVNEDFAGDEGADPKGGC